MKNITKKLLRIRNTNQKKRRPSGKIINNSNSNLLQNKNLLHTTKQQNAFSLPFGKIIISNSNLLRNKNLLHTTKQRHAISLSYNGLEKKYSHLQSILELQHPDPNLYLPAYLQSFSAGSYSFRTSCSISARLMPMLFL